MEQEQKIEGYTHDQIIQWLEQKYESKESHYTYRSLEESTEFTKDINKTKKERLFQIFPSLPIDLVVIQQLPEPIDTDDEPRLKGKKIKEEQFYYYKLFFAISSGKVLRENINDLKQRLMFYQFHLSRISEQKRFYLTIVIPYYVEIPDECVKFCEETGFGLWKINLTNENEVEVCEPITIRQKMIREFKLSLDEPDDLGKTIEKISKKLGQKDSSKLKQEMKELAEDYAIFFDQYILDAVDAISGVTPEKYGKRYIDRTLLNTVFKLKNISYGTKLRELVNEHLDENKDDYEFVSEVFSVLWEDYVGIPYSTFLETFEPALLHIFAEGEGRGRIYRDHYIHQFQVFLLGCYIIDNLYSDFEKYNGDKPEISWLITSSFHDMAYPVQLYDEWSKEFFQKVFKVDIKLANVDLKTSFIEQSFLSCMGYLICELCCVHEGAEVKNNWLAGKKDLVQFFYKEITEGKNHCLLSSMSLLKIIQSQDFSRRKMIEKRMSEGKYNFEEILENYFVPSSLAIALHDTSLWKKLRKENGKDKSPRILENMEFEKNPLAFLLIFCDNIQEWGRPSKSLLQQDREIENRFFLKSIEFDSNLCLTVTIWTPRHDRNAQFFLDKQEELRDIQFFLKQPHDRSFIIHLEDQNSMVESFLMQGAAVEEV